MANDLFSTLKVYLAKVTDGEKSPAELGAALNAWVKESGESVKSKIEEEVESSVSKMGFIKREEFQSLEKEIAELRKNCGATEGVKRAAQGTSKGAKKSAAKRATKKSSAAPVKKSAKKKASAPLKGKSHK
ncbi:MAG: hypothetical protein NTU82_07480 [Actinobacteria bacterium]|nr:hypothetical protein [Actinomycetota bacterium]